MSNKLHTNSHSKASSPAKKVGARLSGMITRLISRLKHGSTNAYSTNAVFIAKKHKGQTATPNAQDPNIRDKKARKSRASTHPAQITPTAIRKSTKPFNGRKFFFAIAKPALLTGLTLGLTGVGALLYFAFVEMAPRVPEATDLWNTNRQSSLVILDRNGKELMGRGARYGEAVSVEELPPYLVAAFLATEDRRFYDHFGVDIRGTLRAAFTNYKKGRVVEGGSTITQQLAKNLFLKPDRTYTRKLREALLAIWLEGRYTKNELLSLYLNRI